MIGRATVLMLIIVALVIPAAAPSHADLATFDVVVEVAPHGSGNDLTLTQDSQGKQVAVYIDHRDVGTARLMARRLDAVGQPVADAVPLDAPADKLSAPSVSTDASNRTTMVWSELKDSAVRIKSVRLDDDGVLGAVQTLHTTSNNAVFGLFQPDSTTDPGGRVTVVFYADSRIWSVRLGLDGVAEFEPQSLSDPSTSSWQYNPKAPQIAADSQGRAQVLWDVGVTPIGPPTGRPSSAQIVSRRLGGDGRPAAPQMLADERFNGPSAGSAALSLAIDSADRPVAAWNHTVPEGGYYYQVVRVLRFGVNGSPDGAPLDVSPPSGTLTSTRLGADTQGRTTVVWARYPAGEVHARIESARLGDNRVLDGPVMQHSAADERPTHFALAVDAQDRAALSWGDSHSGPVRFSRLTRDRLVLVGPQQLAPEESHVNGLALQVAPDGTASVMWSSTTKRIVLAHEAPSEFDVDLHATQLVGNDYVKVDLIVRNPTADTLDGLAGSGFEGITELSAAEFGEENFGDVVPLFLDDRPLPDVLAPGETIRRTHYFLSTEVGSVLLRGEVSATGPDEEMVRDAHYIQVDIELEDDPAQRRFEAMGAMENFISDAQNAIQESSARHGRQRAKQMHKALPKVVRRDWLGGTSGVVVSPIDATIGLLNGVSGEEFATEVPDESVLDKNGKQKIVRKQAAVARARDAVRKADTPAEKRQARKNLTQAQEVLKKTRAKVTITPAEARQVYYKAKAETDNEELFKIYDDLLERPAKALWKEGGATFQWMLQGMSYEGRQQILADLALMADYNDAELGPWVVEPRTKYNESIAEFRDSVAQASERRAKTRQFQLDLMATDPVRAIRISAANDSYYQGQMLRVLIDAFAPSPGAKYLGKEISWGGKVLRDPASRASANLVHAVKQGDELAGRKIFTGADNLGDPATFVDDLTFPSADIGDLIRLDELGRVGGITKRDQRIAEQINRQVSAELSQKYPRANIDFEMAYRPKKSYEPIDSLAKPQLFQEKTLSPRAIQVLDAPEEGLGRQVLFLPKHPSGHPGWKSLSAAQKADDIQLYEDHLYDWTNFHKKNPEGKTAQWKPALKKKTSVEFGGGHTVETKLEAKPLGKNAFEIRATELTVDGERLHKGRPRSFGPDADPAVALDSNSGLKLSGVIESDALEIWNRLALKAQREFGFRAGGHGAPLHGTDLSPEQWVKFARYGAIHLTEAEQKIFESLVVARAGLPPGTKILPGGLPTNVYLVRTTASDSWYGPLGQIYD